jgi:hypothetical protein
MRCLEKRPEDRWQNAHDLLVELETFLAPNAPALPARVSVSDNTAAVTIDRPRHRGFLALALLFASAPFVLALLRILEARDFRFLWMALASLVGAALVRELSTVRPVTSRDVLRRSAFTFALTSLLAGGVPLLLGVKPGGALAAVAMAFGLSWAASSAFDALSRDEGSRVDSAH